MPIRRFTDNITSITLPRDGEPGRTLRLTIDINVNAVHDYVMFDVENGDSPWPRVVLEEMLDYFMETAQQEEVVMSMMKAR